MRLNLTLVAAGIVTAAAGTADYKPEFLAPALFWLALLFIGYNAMLVGLVRIALGPDPERVRGRVIATRLSIWVWAGVGVVLIVLGIVLGKDSAFPPVVLGLTTIGGAIGMWIRKWRGLPVYLWPFMFKAREDPVPSRPDPR